MKKILSVVGARPQFIKSAPVSRELRKEFTEILVHTGQHYDPGMSDIFFNELNIPKPDYNLEIGSASHSVQTGQMLIKLEEVLVKEKPDLVLVYGDTNSTLAGSLAAAKLNIPLAHVEAGLRSFNRKMPEEINRVIADHLSTLLFCPTQTAVENLKKEGITNGVSFIGDVMYDQILSSLKQSQASEILTKYNLQTKNFFYTTIHRAENTDKEENLRNIFQAFSEVGEDFVLPLHPRTQAVIKKIDLKVPANIKIIEPVGYLDNLALMANAKKILTDSGGIQKEAYFLKTPCITLRNETEWPETVQDGWNILVGASSEKIKSAVQNFNPDTSQNNYFGDGNAGLKIVEALKNFSADKN